MSHIVPVRKRTTRGHYCDYHKCHYFMVGHVYLLTKGVTKGVTKI